VLLVALLAVVGGCNVLYDLRETTVNDDLDADGVRDRDDNCSRVPNADQRDTDGDGDGDACALICLTGTRTGKDSDRDRFDDGCDPCPLGPQLDANGDPLDEDGDGTVDACDTCPGQPNPDQADVDGDDVGDACDPDSAHFQTRFVFDGFQTVRSVWTGAADWTATGGAAVTAGGSLSLDTLELFGSADALWSVQLGVDLPATPIEGARVEMTFQGGSCAIAYQGGSYQVVATPSLGTTVQAPMTRTTGVARLTASLQVSGQLRAYLSCATATETAVAQANSIVGPTKVVFTATSQTALTYVDIVN
jgi:hypothetical protein